MLLRPRLVLGLPRRVIKSEPWWNVGKQAFSDMAEGRDVVQRAMGNDDVFFFGFSRIIAENESCSEVRSAWYL